MRLLIDEMFPAAVAEHLRRLGHDAVSVHEVSGLRGMPDDVVLDRAVRSDRVLVTENWVDYAPLTSGRSHPGVLVLLKSRLPRGAALAHAAAQRIQKWSGSHPDPPAGTIDWL